MSSWVDIIEDVIREVEDKFERFFDNIDEMRKMKIRYDIWKIKGYRIYL